MTVLCTGFHIINQGPEIEENIKPAVIKDLGEYVPGQGTTLNLNRIKQFVVIPHFIKWYREPESRKVFPLFLQELSDLNPTGRTVPGLITRNPFFDHTRIKYLAAYRDRVPVGRVAAFISYNYIKQKKENTGWFGLFECEDNRDTAFKLLDHAVDYLRENSCSKVIGPAKFHAGGEIGLLIDGFENDPFFMEPYNPPYYQDLVTGYGFCRENDWFSVNIDKMISREYMDKVNRLFSRILNHRRGKKLEGYSIRNVDFSDVDREIRVIRDLYNPIWNEGNHPQQVKMADDEFRVLALGIKEIAMEELIFIVEKDGSPVGISVNLPDINEVISEMDSKRHRIPSPRFLSPGDMMRDLRIFLQIKKRLRHKSFSRMRFFILGVKEKHRKSGIDSRLFWNIKEKALELGFKKGSASQLADINMDIINPLFRLGQIAMTWRVYSLDI